MQIPTCLHAGVAATGIAVAGIAAMGVASAAPVPQSPSAVAPAVVPPGGLITTFVHNQIVYCSIICPLMVQTGETAVTTTAQAPGTYRAALRSGDQDKAMGVTAASITGPTNVAAEKAILADGTEVAPRALNAFEVGVVGLLDVGPAAAGGPPAIAAALQTARQDTYTAMNRPIVPNPTPTVEPHGVGQVAVVGAINIGASVVFPAFNDVLSGAFEAPDAAARTLATTGDPARAAAAAADTATGVHTAADAVISQAVTTAVDNLRAANG
ncbi:hypothetical protein [Nocardia alni]|uniref:hypothetical protein n=1 Tax=Nocardia alni TaxID=2815723 RepID=UPI001C229EA6|nr:hypothetical protein [Nocardia alni]